MVRLWALTILALTAALLASCGEDEEQLPSLITDASTTPTVSTTPSLSSPVSIPSPNASVPADWPTYEDDQGRYKLRYPPSWFKGDADDFYSVAPSVDTGDDGRIKVEVGYSTALGSDVCGAVLKTDPETGESLGLLPGATPASLGGIEGGRLVRAEGDPAIEDDVTRIEGVGVIRAGSCVLVIAYYTQPIPDTASFEGILKSFEFLD
jgi:hypothetical protein